MAEQTALEAFRVNLATLNRWRELNTKQKEGLVTLREWINLSDIVQDQIRHTKFLIEQTPKFKELDDEIKQQLSLLMRSIKDYVEKFHSRIRDGDVIFKPHCTNIEEPESMAEFYHTMLRLDNYYHQERETV